MTKTHILSGGGMNEKKAVQTFVRKKILTIDELVNLLQCAAITVRRRLRQWSALTSINKNGRYYTLPQIPMFDENGLWRYQSVLFSNHGNLRETIIELIRKSTAGMSAAELARVLDLAPSSYLFTQLSKTTDIKREKHQGRFVYFADDIERYGQQRQTRTLHWPKRVDQPTDAEAVSILVEFIKHPGINMDQLARKVKKQGKKVAPTVIEHFLQTHDLLKKTPDTGR